jgi:hypothetical protein
MFRVFEQFLVTALREALGTRASHLVHGGRGRQLTMGLANANCGQTCHGGMVHSNRFIADIKYKSAPDIRHADPGDLYQLLTYVPRMSLQEC